MRLYCTNATVSTLDYTVLTLLLVLYMRPAGSPQSLTMKVNR